MKVTRLLNVILGDLKHFHLQDCLMIGMFLVALHDHSLPFKEKTSSKSPCRYSFDVFLPSLDFTRKSTIVHGFNPKNKFYHSPNFSPLKNYNKNLFPQFFTVKKKAQIFDFPPLLVTPLQISVPHGSCCFDS